MPWASLGCSQAITGCPCRGGLWVVPGCIEGALWHCCFGSRQPCHVFCWFQQVFCNLLRGRRGARRAACGVAAWRRRPRPAEG